MSILRAAPLVCFRYDGTTSRSCPPFSLSARIRQQQLTLVIHTLPSFTQIRELLDIHKRAAAQSAAEAEAGLVLMDRGSSASAASQPDRDFQLRFYRTLAGGQDPSRFELPKSFYEVGSGDLSAARAGSGSKEEMLMTASMRAKAAEPKRRYTKCLIRVRVANALESDGTQIIIQATFRPNDKVSTLTKLVKESLMEFERPFKLTAPPNLVLSVPSQTFQQAGLVPASLLQFRWNDDRVQDAQVNLLSELMEQVVPLEDAVIE